MTSHGPSEPWAPKRRSLRLAWVLVYRLLSGSLWGPVTSKKSLLTCGRSRKPGRPSAKEAAGPLATIFVGRTPTFRGSGGVRQPRPLNGAGWRCASPTSAAPWPVMPPALQRPMMAEIKLPTFAGTVLASREATFRGSQGWPDLANILPSSAQIGRRGPKSSQPLLGTFGAGRVRSGKLSGTHGERRPQRRPNAIRRRLWPLRLVLPPPTGQGESSLVGAPRAPSPSAVFSGGAGGSNAPDVTAFSEALRGGQPGIGLGGNTSVAHLIHRAAPSCSAAAVSGLGPP